MYEPDAGRVEFPFPRRQAAVGLRSLIFAPLLVESTTRRLLVAARRTEAGFSSGDGEFLAGLCAHVALAAHQAQLYGALEQAYEISARPSRR